MTNLNNARLEPCYVVNNELWRLYCGMVGRDPTNVAEHWTEYDVVAAILMRASSVQTLEHTR